MESKNFWKQAYGIEKLGLMNPNTAEIKNCLHKLIVEPDDERILRKVQAYFTTLTSKNLDWWDTISDQEKEEINMVFSNLKTAKGYHMKK